MTLKNLNSRTTLAVSTSPNVSVKSVNDGLIKNVAINAVSGVGYIDRKSQYLQQDVKQEYTSLKLSDQKSIGKSRQSCLYKTSVVSSNNGTLKVVEQKTCGKVSNASPMLDRLCLNEEILGENELILRNLSSTNTTVQSPILPDVSVKSVTYVVGDQRFREDVRSRDSSESNNQNGIDENKQNYIFDASVVSSDNSVLKVVEQKTYHERGQENNTSFASASIRSRRAFRTKKLTLKNLSSGTTSTTVTTDISSFPNTIEPVSFACILSKGLLNSENFKYDSKSKVKERSTASNVDCVSNREKSPINALSNIECKSELAYEYLQQGARPKNSSSKSSKIVGDELLSNRKDIAKDEQSYKSKITDDVLKVVEQKAYDNGDFTKGYTSFTSNQRSIAENGQSCKSKTTGNVLEVVKQKACDNGELAKNYTSFTSHNVRAKRMYKFSELKLRNPGSRKSTLVLPVISDFAFESTGMLAENVSCVDYIGNREKLSVDLASNVECKGNLGKCLKQDAMSHGFQRIDNSSMDTTVCKSLTQASDLQDIRSKFIRTSVREYSRSEYKNYVVNFKHRINCFRKMHLKYLANLMQYVFYVDGKKLLVNPQVKRNILCSTQSFPLCLFIIKVSLLTHLLSLFNFSTAMNVFRYYAKYFYDQSLIDSILCNLLCVFQIYGHNDDVMEQMRCVFLGYCLDLCYESSYEKYQGRFYFDVYNVCCDFLMTKDSQNERFNVLANFIKLSCAQQLGIMYHMIVKYTSFDDSLRVLSYQRTMFSAPNFVIQLLLNFRVALAHLYHPDETKGIYVVYGLRIPYLIIQSCNRNIGEEILANMENGTMDFNVFVENMTCCFKSVLLNIENLVGEDTQLYNAVINQMNLQVIEQSCAARSLC
ncbi:DUF3514 domain-containing protein [Ehrlichia sp. JZT12]